MYIDKDTYPRGTSVRYWVWQGIMLDHEGVIVEDLEDGVCQCGECGTYGIRATGEDYDNMCYFGICTEIAMCAVHDIRKLTWSEEDQQSVDQMRSSTLTVCDLCINEAYDQGFEGYLAQAHCMVEFGLDMADHLCDEVETEGEIKCQCGCRTRVTTPWN
ncbi:hypothetical protein LCGC14_1974970 [marine sediment metagenome]|uniref:Uncharacterized protein n=1 Tax=marine sediment metagenome TaxID=412755 RepID=A0A0F9FB07_9ZZZZ